MVFRRDVSTCLRFNLHPVNTKEIMKYLSSITLNKTNNGKKIPVCVRACIFLPVAVSLD